MHERRTGTAIPDIWDPPSHGYNTFRKSLSRRLAERGKGPKHVVQQGLSLYDHRFHLVFRDVDDVAVVESIAKAMDIIEPAPLLRGPFQGMGKTLEYSSSVAFGAREPIARRLERNTSEPERCVVRRSEPRCERIGLSARVYKGFGCPLREATQRIPIGLSAVQRGPYALCEIFEICSFDHVRHPLTRMFPVSAHRL